MSVTIRDVRREDGARLAALNVASRALHLPWVEPFQDEAGFAAWFAGIGERRRSFVVEDSGAPAGIVNVSEIVRGGFENAYLGYYAFAGGAGRGVMSAGLGLVIGLAFAEMGLHRLEANIQPGNAASRALARRLGFRLEGFSPRYLRIGGEWRDHERWAITREEWPWPRALGSPY